MSRSENCID